MRAFFVASNLPTPRPPQGGGEEMFSERITFEPLQRNLKEI